MPQPTRRCLKQSWSDMAVAVATDGSGGMRSSWQPEMMVTTRLKEKSRMLQAADRSRVQEKQEGQIEGFQDHGQIIGYEELASKGTQAPNEASASFILSRSGCPSQPLTSPTHRC